MPYKSLADANPSIRGIRPKVTLEQANEIARIADAIAETNPDGAWPIAIFQFKKKLYTVRGGRWVKRQKVKPVAERIYREYGEGLRGRKSAEESFDMEPLEEAATYKTKCQALIRDLNSIMQDRTLPPQMRTSLSHVQTELRRTWADLEKDGQGVDEMDPIEEVMKTVGGKSYPASDFLVIEDPEQPSTWRLQVKRNGTPDHNLMAAARGALTNPNYRGGKPYAGPNKQEALRKLKALYKSEEMVWESDVTEDYAMPSYVSTFGATSFSDLDAAENAQDAAQEAQKRVYQFQSLVSNALASDQLTDKVAAIKKIADEFVSLMSELFANPTTPTAENVAELAEAVGDEPIDVAGTALELVEAGTVSEGGDKPLILNVVPIKPGWGNKRDNHFYPVDVLQRDGPRVFPKVKMYETDHKAEEKSNRTWVSSVMEMAGQTPDGAPIVKVGIHDPYFAQKVLNLNKLGLLNMMECSIYGKGRVRDGFERDGRKGKLLEGIDELASLDWVTRAGAGGHALDIVAESDQGGHQVNEQTATPPATSGATSVPATPVTQPAPVQETQSEFLAEADVKKLIDGSNLPSISKSRLVEIQFKDEAAVRDAISKETEYVKAVTGAGQPNNLGATSAPPERISEADHQKHLDEIDKRFGLR